MKILALKIRVIQPTNRWQSPEASRDKKFIVPWSLLEEPDAVAILVSAQVS